VSKKGVVTGYYDFFFNAVMDEINKNKTRKAIWFEYNNRIKDKKLYGFCIKTVLLQLILKFYYDLFNDRFW